MIKDIERLLLEAQKESNLELKLRQLNLIDKKLYQFITSPNTSAKDLVEAKRLLQLLAFSNN